MRHGPGHLHHPGPAVRHTPGLWLAACMTLAGCSGIELSPENPPDINLSGVWILDVINSDVVPDLRNRRGDKNRRGVGRGGSRQAIIARAAGSGLSFIRHDFQVLSASKIEIEQNRDSMGVQHVPGVYRDISWGEKQRGLWEVHAGWENRELVVISEASDLKVQERYQLQDNGSRLLVEIMISADNEEFEFRREFTRES